MHNKIPLIVLVLLIIIISARALYLDADPPLDLTKFNDVITDPSNLTLSAREIVNDDIPNNNIPDRYIIFKYTTITGLGLLIFNLFGISYLTSNLIGLILSLGSLFLFMMIVHKISGWLGSLFYLILISFNYNQIFYGRLPFAEHSLIFWAALAFVIILYSKKPILSFTAGLSLGMSIFFGKVTGVVFVIPFIIYYGYDYFIANKKDSKTKAVYFFSGICVLAGLWLAFVYLPNMNEIARYYKEQIGDNHGFPVALTSILIFIDKFITLGISSNFISRMFISLSLSFGFIVLFLHNLPFKKLDKNNSDDFTPKLLLILFFVSNYIFLMLWSYNPMRYQLVLIYPAVALAAILLSQLWENKKILTRQKINVYFIILAIPFYSILISFIVYIINLEFELKVRGIGLLLFVIFVSIILSLISYLVIKKNLQNKIIKNRKIIRGLIIAAISLVFIFDFTHYISWAKLPIYSVRDSSRDFKTILNNNAVIAGSHASPLAIETDYSTMIHMFGVADPDPDLFSKYPITHLLIDNNNEIRAREDYPDIMNNAFLILNYNIGNSNVKLFRISDTTDNNTAHTYKVSIFENAVLRLNYNRTRLLNRYLSNYLNQFPDNFSGYVLNGLINLRQNRYDTYKEDLFKALEFSPTNFNVNRLIALYYADQFKKSQNPEFKELSIQYFDKAANLISDPSSILSEKNKMLN